MIFTRNRSNNNVVVVFKSNRLPFFMIRVSSWRSAHWNLSSTVRIFREPLSRLHRNSTFLTNLLCIRSRNSISKIFEGRHIWLTYITIGITFDSCSLRYVVSFFTHRLRRIMLQIFEHDFATCCTYSAKFIFDEKRTPRSSTASIFSKVAPFSLKTVFLFLDPRCRTPHFNL